MATYPFVSLLMPIRNEASFIEGSVQSVLNQDYPAECLEIIIADGMSTDGTREIIQRAGSKRDNVHIINNEQGIVPTGLNAALRKAKGEIIIRIDGHCEIAPDFVKRCVGHLQQRKADGVGGPIETIGETFWAKTIATAMSSPFGVGGSAFRTVKDKEMFVDTIPFPAYRRSTVERAGLFDEELVRNQDDEYNYRLRELGHKLLLAPDIRSRYYSRCNLHSLWRQYFQYGYWKVRVMQKHPLQMSVRQFVPALFVFSVMLSYMLGLFFTLGRWMLGGILISYLLANILATLVTARRKGWGFLFTLPLAFITLHLSYGLGFLAGLIQFWNRWKDKTGKTPQLIEVVRT
jgi:glycosyltransferase involved in cell wall biosynthesis